MSEILKTEYDPSKAYVWKPEDSFTLTGGEFGFLFNTLVKREREILEEMERINILKAKLKEAVESGVATERPPDPVEVL